MPGCSAREAKVNPENENVCKEHMVIQRFYITRDGMVSSIEFSLQVIFSCCTNLGLRGGDAQIAGGGHTHAGSDGGAVDRSNDWHRQLTQRQEARVKIAHGERVVDRRILRALEQELEIAARAEGATLTSQHHSLQARILLQRVDSAQELFAHLNLESRMNIKSKEEAQLLIRIVQNLKINKFNSNRHGVQ